MTKLRTDAEIIRSCIKLAIDFFSGDTDKASTWLHTANESFQGNRPIDFMSLNPLRGEEITLVLMGSHIP